jgi:hypothetical protein
VSKVSSPFLEDHVDAEDITTKVNQLGTSLLALAAIRECAVWPEAMSGGANACAPGCFESGGGATIGIIVQLWTFAALVWTIIVCVRQTPAFKLSQKNKSGIFEFSDVNPATHAVQILPSFQAPVIYDIEYEKRVRIWEAFWDSLFDVLVDDAHGIDGSPAGKLVVHRMFEDKAKLEFVTRWKTIKHSYQCRFEEDENASGDQTTQMEYEHADLKKIDLDLDALFHQVYCQPTLTFADAMQILESSAPPLFALSMYDETKNVFEHFKSQLDCTSSAEACYWFCFWSDFWFKNSELEILQDKHQLFSFTEPGSLCFKVISRIELENTLLQCALWNDKGSGTKPHLFFPELFDRLYAEMGRADAVKGMTADLKMFLFQAPWQVNMSVLSGKNKTKIKGSRPESRKTPKTLQPQKDADTKIKKVMKKHPAKTVFPAGVITDAGGEAVTQPGQTGGI